MEVGEAREIVQKIVAAYPSFLKGDNAKAKAILWRDHLLQMDYKKVSARLDRYIQSSVYEPKIADIKPVEIEKTNYESMKDFKERIANHRGEPLNSKSYQERLNKLMANESVRKDIERKKRLFEERRGNS